MKRDNRVSEKQKEIMIEFVMDNAEFAKNKLLGVEGRKLPNSLWCVLTLALNNEGAEKAVKKWQRVSTLLLLLNDILLYVYTL